MAEATFSLNDIFSYIYGRGRIFSWWYLQMHLWQRPYFLLMISSAVFMTEAVFSLDDIFSCIYDWGRIFPWWYIQLHLWQRPYFSSWWLQLHLYQRPYFLLMIYLQLKKLWQLNFDEFLLTGWSECHILYHWIDNDIWLSLHPINKYS